MLKTISVTFSQRILLIIYNEIALKRRIAKQKENGDDEYEIEVSDDEEPNEANSKHQKVLQLIRDYIIINNLGIRESFGLPDITVDHFLEFHELKAIIKRI